MTSKIADLEREIQALQDQLTIERERAQRSALTRIEEIQRIVAPLIQEAEDLSRTAGITFYASTFVEGALNGASADYPYWQQSEYC